MVVILNLNINTIFLIYLSCVYLQNTGYTRRIHCRIRGLLPPPLPEILKHPAVCLICPPLCRLDHHPKPRRNQRAYNCIALRHRRDWQPERKLPHPIFPRVVQIRVQFFIEIKDDFRHPEMPARLCIRIPDP